MVQKPAIKPDIIKKYLEDLNLEYSYLDVELNTDSAEELRVFMKLENKFPNHYDWRKQEETPQIRT
jgi:glutaredoxin-related protein